MARKEWARSKKLTAIIIAAVAMVVAVVAALLLWPKNVSIFIDPQEITLEVGETYVVTYEVNEKLILGVDEP